jgi:hypothetical protein
MEEETAERRGDGAQECVEVVIGNMTTGVSGSDIPATSSTQHNMHNSEHLPEVFHPATNSIQIRLPLITSCTVLINKYTIAISSIMQLFIIF